MCARRAILGAEPSPCPACLDTGRVTTEVDLLARVAMHHMPADSTVTSFSTPERKQLRADLAAYFEARR